MPDEKKYLDYDGLDLYTDYVKALIQAGSVEITIDSELSSTSNNPVKNKVIKAALDSKPDSSELDHYYDLDRGTLIPANSDLNSYTTVGTYYRNNSNSAVSTLSNCPVTAAFKMTVEQIISDSYLKQRITTYQGSAEEWTRNTSDGGATWNDWWRATPRNTTAATANRFLATPNGSAGLPDYRAIANADLPTVDAAHGGTGETTLRSSANALINSLNTATGSGFSDDAYVITEALAGDTDVFYRRPISYIWDWIKSKAAEFFPFLIGGTELFSTDNLNNITTVGTYYVRSNAATPTNAPVSTFVGKIIVDVPHGLPSSAVRAQHAVSYASGTKYYRVYENGAWSSWYRQAPWSTDTEAANKVLATPNGSAGWPSFRSLAAADLPDSYYSSTVSRTANRVLAAPNGSSGAATFRKLVDADLPVSLTSKQYNVLSKITQTSTQSGRFTLTSATIETSGYVVQIRIGFKLASALTAGTEYTMGTLDTAIRPALGCDAGIGDRRAFATISAGTLYIRPEVAMSVDSTEYYFNATYITSSAYTG